MPMRHALKRDKPVDKLRKTMAFPLRHDFAGFRGDV